MIEYSGRRIPVVRVLWEHVDWVRFPAARQGGEVLFACLYEYENVLNKSSGNF